MPRPRPFAAARGHSDRCAAQPTPPRGASCRQVCHDPSAVRHDRRGRAWGRHGVGSRDRRAARRRAGRSAYGRSRRRRPWKVRSSLAVPRTPTSTLGVLGCAALELVGGRKRRWARGGDGAPAVDGRRGGHAGCRARGAAIRPSPSPAFAVVRARRPRGRRRGWCARRWLAWRPAAWRRCWVHGSFLRCR